MDSNQRQFEYENPFRFRNYVENNDNIGAFLRSFDEILLLFRETWVRMILKA